MVTSALVGVLSMVTRTVTLATKSHDPLTRVWGLEFGHSEVRARSSGRKPNNLGPEAGHAGKH